MTDLAGDEVVGDLSLPNEPPEAVGAAARDLDDALLAALAEMAVRSHRRQADVFIAVRRAGLTAGVEHLNEALLRLRRDGCVDQVVVLADGGILLSVTGRAIERLSHTAYQYVVAAA
jgi:hypothetical protein